MLLNVFIHSEDKLHIIIQCVGGCEKSQYLIFWSYYLLRSRLPTHGHRMVPSCPPINDAPYSNRRKGQSDSLNRRTRKRISMKQIEERTTLLTPEETLLIFIQVIALTLVTALDMRHYCHYSAVTYHTHARTYANTHAHSANSGS